MYEPMKLDELQSEAIRRAEQQSFEASLKRSSKPESETTERDARIATERRAEAAEAEVAEAKAFLAGQHKLTYCESHRDVDFGEWQESGGPECPLCQQAKIEALEAAVSERDEAIRDLRPAADLMRQERDQAERRLAALVTAAKVASEQMGVATLDVGGHVWGGDIKEFSVAIAKAEREAAPLAEVVARASGAEGGDAC